MAFFNSKLKNDRIDSILGRYNMKLAKYLEVYSEIKRRIVEDVYKVGDKLPSGEDIGTEFGVSRLTVKKGMDMLVNEGVIHSRSGYGTVVLRKPITNSKIFGPNDGLLDVVGSEHVESDVHKFSIELPSEEIAEKLNITTKDYIYNIVRSRKVDNNPYSLEQTFMPLIVIPGLEPKHLKSSVYNYIRNELMLQIKSSHIRLKGDLANKRDKEILGVDVGHFMIEIEKVVSLASGQPFEYSITRHLYEDFSFESVTVDN